MLVCRAERRADNWMLIILSSVVKPLEIISLDGRSITVWGCSWYDCNLDLATVHGTINGRRYQNTILDGDVFSHFDPAQCSWMALLDLIVSEQCSPSTAEYNINIIIVNMKPWSQLQWACLGHIVVQIAQELTCTIHKERKIFLHLWAKRLASSMRRLVQYTICAQGGYTRYWFDLLNMLRYWLTDMIRFVYTVEQFCLLLMNYLLLCHCLNLNML